MNKNTRALVLVMALVMLVGILVGCGRKTEVPSVSISGTPGEGGAITVKGPEGEVTVTGTEGSGEVDIKGEKGDVKITAGEEGGTVTATGAEGTTTITTAKADVNLDKMGMPSYPGATVESSTSMEMQGPKGVKGNQVIVIMETDDPVAKVAQFYEGKLEGFSKVSASSAEMETVAFSNTTTGSLSAESGEGKTVTIAREAGEGKTKINIVVATFPPSE